MLKNYMKEGQKLPLFGVGPYIIYGIAMVNLIGIILFGYVFKIGILQSPWTLIFRIAGALLIILGILIWYIGALRSDMDASITENKLQTKGIYAWAIMTIALINTEEKWLLKLYGDEYAEYKKHVNRCIPWKRK